MWDVAVVGAGPAGASAALAVRRHLPAADVVLIDRAGFPRDKACGDGIAPHALDVLAGLGVTDVVRGFVPVSRLRLGLAGGAEVSGDMGRPAYVVPRRDFDARLVAGATSLGATLVRHRVRQVEVCADRVVLDGEVAARVLVAADGAESACRRALGLAPNRPRHRALALRGYAPVSRGRESEQVIAFGEARRPAYAWSFPVGDGRANVGYGELLGAGRTLTRAGLLGRLERLLPGAGQGGGEWRAHHLPLSTSRPRQPDGRVLLAGDAASLVNPVTGEGIYYAVLSGALAGESAAIALADGSDAGARHRAALRAVLGRHLRHTRVAAALARTPCVVPAAMHAADADSAVFDDLVEMGLGGGLVTPRLVRGLAYGLGRGLVRR